MPSQEVHVEGFDAFKSKVEELTAAKKTVIVLFSGSKNDKGESWCPDCVKADPVIDAAVKSQEGDVVLLHVGVGDRAFWKDPNCVFRKDPSTRLRCVPTLVKWGTPQKLEEEQCSDPNMVNLMFEDD